MTFRNTKNGLNSVLVAGSAYLGAGIAFYISSNIIGLPHLPYSATWSLLPEDLRDTRDSLTFITMTAWGLHYVRRFTEVLFVHIYKGNMSWLESIGVHLYYWVFGFIVGWSVNYRMGYNSPRVEFYSVGILLFLIGEVGNCICHVILRNLRKPSNQVRLVDDAGEIREVPKTRHVIPRGFLFEYISCPHYFFEIVAWLGFALMTITVASLLFLTATFITLVILSLMKHKSYKADFDGKDGTERYPPNRKALIPFIL